MGDIRVEFTLHALNEAWNDAVSEAAMIEVVQAARVIDRNGENGTVVIWGRVDGRVIHVVTDWPWGEPDESGIRDVTVVTVYDPSRDPKKRFLPPEYVRRRKRPKAQ